MTPTEKSDFIRKSFKLTSRSRKLRGTVHSVGVNDSDYITAPRIHGKQSVCPAYDCWVSMLLRCYDPIAVKKRPTYIHVTVCEEWRGFMAFRSWWMDNQVEGWQIDKDLLIFGNKEYRPEACVFIPQWLNTFMCDQENRRGEWPIGVSRDAGRSTFSAYCRDPINKKGEYLGRFRTPTEANHAYIERKLEHIARFKPEIDAIDARIHPSLIRIMESRRV